LVPRRITVAVVASLYRSGWSVAADDDGELAEQRELSGRCRPRRTASAVCKLDVHSRAALTAVIARAAP
jgi:hypothetical protein